MPLGTPRHVFVPAHRFVWPDRSLRRRSLVRLTDACLRVGGVVFAAAMGAILHVSPARAQLAQVDNVQIPPPPASAAVAPPTPTPTPTASASAAPASSAVPSPAPTSALPGPLDAPATIAPSRTLPVSGKPLLLTGLPRARGGKQLVWNEEWSRFDRWDAAFTALVGASTLTTAIVRPIFPFRRGGILFDESFRRKVRANSYDTRGAYADLSDVLLSLSISGPILVDSLTVAYWYRGSPDVAWEIALIDVETMLATAAVQGIFSTFTARERPYGRVCGAEIPNDNNACDSYDRYRSFFSGHTSLAFASASLVCSHHLRLELFDSRAADITSCVTSYTAAAATGTLRILGDRHYASDVLAGAVIGTTMGLAVPYFMHYRVRAPALVKDGVRVGVVPNGAGMSIVGAF